MWRNSPFFVSSGLEDSVGGKMFSAKSSRSVQKWMFRVPLFSWFTSETRICTWVSLLSRSLKMSISTESHRNFEHHNCLHWRTQGRVDTWEVLPRIENLKRWKCRWRIWVRIMWQVLPKMKPHSSLVLRFNLKGLLDTTYMDSYSIIRIWYTYSTMTWQIAKSNNQLYAFVCILDT